MSGINYTNTATTIVKKIFDHERAVEQMIVSCPLFKSLRKKAIGLGSDYTSAIQNSYSQGMGVRGDNEALPEPGNPDFDTPVWNPKTQYYRIQITGSAWERTKDNKKAFAMLLKDETVNAFTAYGREQERILFGDSTGLRGVTDGAIVAGSSVTVTVSATLPSANPVHVPLRGIFKGMRVDFYNNTTGQKITEGVVDSVSKAAGTFVITTLDANVADGSYIYRSGNRNREPNGLTNVVDDGTLTSTLGGVTTAAEWAANRLGNSGTARAINTDLMDQAYLKTMEQDDTDPDVIWMPYNVYRKLLQAHTRTMQFQNNTGKPMNLNLGNDVPMYNAAQVKISSMAPKGQMFFLQSKSIEIIEEFGFKWITEADSSNIWFKVEGYDKFEATAKNSYELRCKRRNTNTVLADISET